MEKEKKKIEMEKQMKLSAELKAVKEYYSNHQDVSQLAVYSIRVVYS